jgi:hypothetical protein
VSTIEQTCKGAENVRTPLAHLSHMLNLRVLVGEKAIMWGLAVGSWTRGSCSAVLSGQMAEQKKTMEIPSL